MKLELEITKQVEDGDKYGNEEYKVALARDDLDATYVGVDYCPGKAFRIALQGLMFAMVERCST